MIQKKRRPKVKIPSYVKIMAMLSPTRTGKIDRKYIHSMSVAIGEYERHKNTAMKKVYKDTSTEAD